VRPPRVRAVAWLAVLLVAALPVAPAGGEEYHHAGLVVRHGDGRFVYAYVAFPEEAISGVELLRRSGISLVTVQFGGLGEGVCTLDGEGCPAGDCRKRVCQGSGADDPYWQYFRQTTPGVWSSLSLGASSTKVHDGDVDGWSWTAGHDAGLPPLTLADVARQTGVPATPAGGGSAGTLPTPAVRVVFPEGVVPPTDGDGQGPVTYVAAAGALAAIGGGALFAARRRSRTERAA
jgi:hypothetical protein